MDLDDVKRLEFRLEAHIPRYLEIPVLKFLTDCSYLEQVASCGR